LNDNLLPNGQWFITLQLTNVDHSKFVGIIIIHKTGENKTNLTIFVHTIIYTITRVDAKHNNIIKSKPYVMIKNTLIITTANAYRNYQILI